MRSRRPVVLLLHKNAAAVRQHEGGDVDRVFFGVFARDCTRLVVASPATEGFSRFDPGNPPAHITERERRSDLPHPAVELSRKTAQHGGFAGQVDAPDSSRDCLESDCAGKFAALLGHVACLLEHSMTRGSIKDALSVLGRGRTAGRDQSFSGLALGAGALPLSAPKP
jgi:hypothetical protein